MWKNGRNPASQSYENLDWWEGTNGAVRASPHLLQVELFDTGFIWSNSRAFDTDTVLDDGIGSVDCYLVIGLAQRNNGQCAVRCRGVCSTHTWSLYSNPKSKYLISSSRYGRMSYMKWLVKIQRDIVQLTSSRIFFHMILVISSPSNSTTGFWTLIFCVMASR